MQNSDLKYFKLIFRSREAYLNSSKILTQNYKLFRIQGINEKKVCETFEQKLENAFGVGAWANQMAFSGKLLSQQYILNSVSWWLVELFSRHKLKVIKFASSESNAIRSTDRVRSLVKCYFF